MGCFFQFYFFSTSVSLAGNFGLTCIKAKKSFRRHTSMYITIRKIAVVMRQGWEDECQVVGHGSFALPNACCLSTIMCV